MEAIVLGAGVSGKAAAKLLEHRGYRVTIADDLDKSFIHSEQIIGQACDIAVVSPGIAPTHKAYQYLKQHAPVFLGEAELAMQQCKQIAIGITGTNGKTSTAMLVTHVLNYAGKKAVCLGNIGEPLCQYFIDPNLKEILVVELSSFQLETMTTPAFLAVALLNITPDHLDRHQTMLSYAKAKLRIGELVQDKAQFYCLEKTLSDYPTEATSFGPMKELAHLAKHLQENFHAAYLLVSQLGVSKEMFLQSLASFVMPKHRIQWVGQHAGISYFNDSKGTTPESTDVAIQTMPAQTILLAGGQDKGLDFTMWNQHASKLKKIILFGQAKEKIYSQLANLDIILCQTLKEAFQKAHEIAVSGDAILLSPGCASFDQYRSYTERGDEFIQLVLAKTKF